MGVCVYIYKEIKREGGLRNRDWKKTEIIGRGDLRRSLFFPLSSLFFFSFIA